MSEMTFPHYPVAAGAFYDELILPYSKSKCNAHCHFTLLFLFFAIFSWMLTRVGASAGVRRPTIICFFLPALGLHCRCRRVLSAQPEKSAHPKSFE